MLLTYVSLASISPRDASSFCRSMPTTVASSTVPAKVAAAEAEDADEGDDKDDAVVMLASKAQKTDDGSGREVTVQRMQALWSSVAKYLGLHVITGRSNAMNIDVMYGNAMQFNVK